MAQTGYTPIQLYYSSTTTNVPTAGNLSNGELAINITDGKLFYKDNLGVVQTLASKSDITTISFGSTGLTPSTATGGAVTVAGTLAVANGGTGLISGTSGGVLYYSASGTLASSAALTANAIVLGGGAGAAPATTTTGTGVVTALGQNVTGSGGIVLATSPSLTTPTLGVASATTINKVTITAPATGSTLTIADGKTLTVNNSITFSGTDSTTMTLPGVNATLAALTVAQTFTATQTFYQDIYTNNTVTVTSNAGTVPITYKLNTFTNSSAATMTITMATASAVDGQMSIVRIYDFSAVAQTISWVNTENSTVSVPTTSNGSTTLPLTVGFMYNGQTSKWRCIASA